MAGAAKCMARVVESGSWLSKACRPLETRSVMKASLWQAGLPAGRAEKAGSPRPAGSKGLQRQDNFMSPILLFGLSLYGRRE